MLLAILPSTGQDQSSLISILIIGAVLVAAGIAAMVAVRASRKKNDSASTFKPAAGDSGATAVKKPAAEKPAAKTPAPKKPAAKKPAPKKPASDKK